MKTNAAIAGKIPTITGTLYFANDPDMSLTDKDFVAGSVRQTSGTSNGGEFTVGGAVIGSLEFELNNASGRFTGVDWYNSRVHIYFTVGNTTVDGGYYWVVDHHETGQRIRVECHDCLKILDEYEIYELGITWPSTVGAVVNAMATARSLTVTGLTSAEQAIALVDPKNDHMTQRACLSYIAQILGKYVTGFGYNLRFGWYDTSTSYNAGVTFSHDLRTDMQTITGCVVSDREEANPQTRGTSSYRITIDSNPFITQDNVSSIADRIYNAVNGISYHPGDVEILSNPAIEAGDRLSVNTGNETGVIVLATSVTYKPGVRMRVTADSEPYAGDLRVKRKAYIKQIADEVSEEVVNNVIGNKSMIVLHTLGRPLTIRKGTTPSGWSNREIQFMTNIPLKVNITSSTWGDVPARLYDVEDLIIPRQQIHVCDELYNGSDVGYWWGVTRMRFAVTVYISSEETAVFAFYADALYRTHYQQTPGGMMRTIEFTPLLTGPIQSANEYNPYNDPSHSAQEYGGYGTYDEQYLKQRPLGANGNYSYYIEGTLRQTDKLRFMQGTDSYITAIAG